MTISLPDDVAERLDREPNASAFIAAAVREQQRREDVGAMLAAAGFPLTPTGKTRARQRLDTARQRANDPQAAHVRQALRAELASQ